MNSSINNAGILVLFACNQAVASEIKRATLAQLCYRFITMITILNKVSRLACGSRLRQQSLGEGDVVSKFETSHCNPVGNQSHPVRASHLPEASLASPSVMAALSADSECKSRVIERRNHSSCGSLRGSRSGGNTVSLKRLGARIRN